MSVCVHVRLAIIVKVKELATALSVVHTCTCTRGRHLNNIMCNTYDYDVLGDLVYCRNGCGSPYCSVYYRKVTKSPWILTKVPQNFAEVTRSRRLFW